MNLGSTPARPKFLFHGAGFKDLIKSFRVVSGLVGFQMVFIVFLLYGGHYIGSSYRVS